MANKQIVEFDEKSALAAGDQFLLQDGESGSYQRASLANLTRRKTALNLVIGDGSAVPATGIAGHIYLPLDCIIEVKGWRLSSHDGSSGSVQLDLWHDQNRASLDNSDSICGGGNEPALSSQSENASTGLAAWAETTLESGCLAVNIDSITGFTQLTLALDVEISLQEEEV